VTVVEILIFAQRFSGALSVFMGRMLSL